VALAEERSFTRAARRERIVQSGLSASVRALERELRAELFVRSTRPVRLTREGDALLPAAYRTLEAADVARRVVRDTQAVLHGRLRVGMMRSDGHPLPVGEWLAAFARTHPRVTVSIEQPPGLKSLALVRSGELDCALVPGAPARDPDLDVVTLLTEPLVLACAAGDPLAARDAVRLDHLEGRSFVDPHPEWSIRTRIDDLLTRSGISREVVAEVEEWGVALDLVAAGVGVALVPAGLARLRHRGGCGEVALVPFADVRAEISVDLVLPHGRSASPAGRAFRDLVVSAHRPGARG
jgi:DNA-binding transcriptional LysR family regulator